MNISSICLDASAVVTLITNQEATRMLALWQQWEEEKRPFVAPTLLYYEVSNALHQYRRHGLISDDILAVNMQTVLALPIRLYMDSGLHLRAVALAAAYDLPATYDAHYLAVAERFGAELWTTDQRFHRKTAHFPWVHLVRESIHDE